MQATTLTRAADGKFHPHGPQPRTAAEARDFLQKKLLAEVANGITSTIDGFTKQARSQDNTADDLNLDPGTVVLGNKPVRGGLDDVLTARESATFDPASGETLSYEREVSGTMCHTEPGSSWIDPVDYPEGIPFSLQMADLIRAKLSPQRNHDIPARDVITYKKGPLLQIDSDITRGKPNSDRKLSEHFHLQETEPGLFAVEYEITNNLGLYHSEPSANSGE